MIDLQLEADVRAHGAQDEYVHAWGMMHPVEALAAVVRSGVIWPVDDSWTTLSAGTVAVCRQVEAQVWI